MKGVRFVWVCASENAAIITLMAAITTQTNQSRAVLPKMSARTLVGAFEANRAPTCPE